MNIIIVEIGKEQLFQYARVPIAFEVHSQLHPALVDGGLGGILLREEPVEPPYIKNYDADQVGDHPGNWGERFDVRNWTFFLALAGELPVGGATVAFRTPGLHMLEERDDLAVLWDLRVHPDWRGQGIGRRLFWQAAAWAQAQGCSQLKVETQNVNVPACRFYARQGCRLGCLDRYGYSGHPEVRHEVMLLWYLELYHRPAALEEKKQAGG